MYKLLEGINMPEDVKKLNNKELKDLSKEIRKFLVKKVSKTGGHLASNLGVVELTLAIHKVFDSPKDKIIWDVGHQSYVHKIVTGRKEAFDSLRQFKGMSGFPKESESEHDIFDTGHSATSVSVALGLAAARDIKREKYQILAVIGDGSITGGMAVEALNNLGYMKKNVIVIFNDNEMSIDKNTGAFASYMSKIIKNSEALNLKDRVDKIMNLTSMGGALSRKANKLTDSIISSISPSECGFIDALGIKYIGPIDGHDIDELVDILEYAKEIEGPKFIHVKTVKGKGYRFSEERPEDYHGVGKFDYRKGVKKSDKKSISSIVGRTLTDMADSNDKIVAVTAAMPTGTGLNIFEKFHPERYFDVGIAEQHAVTFSAGLAKAGMKPYFAVYSTFLQRGYDQLIHDVCITKKAVSFLIDRAGLVGNDGETHHGEFDLSYLNPIPNITVMAPCDTREMVEMIKLSEKIDSPLAIRYPRGSEYYFNKQDYTFMKGHEVENLPISKESISQAQIIYDAFEKNKKKILIITIGNMLIPIMQAVELLLKEREDLSFRIVNARYLKPLDKDKYKELIKDSDIIYTVEDNVVTGGFGSSIENIVEEFNLKNRLVKIGIPDIFVTHGNTDLLMDEIGMSVEKLKERIGGC